MAKMREQMQGGGDRDAMREKMAKMRDEQNKEMKKILTADAIRQIRKIFGRKTCRQTGWGKPIVLV